MISHIRLIEGFGYASEKNKDGKPINEKLYKGIVERSFEFVEDKVNIIFGPNGSGKTTLLRAIAGYAGCEDGFTKKLKWFRNEEDPMETLKNSYRKLAQNEAILDWDGAPVYYENFRDTMEYRDGDLSGSILSDTSEEISWIMNKKRISEGQRSIFFLTKVIKLFKKYENRPKWEDILEGGKEEQLNYHLSFPKANTGTPTLLFDEEEKSLDIINQIDTLTKLYLFIVKVLKIQVIAISHNSLILCDKIFKNPDFNIISIDPEYTLETKKTLEKLWLSNS